jgi:hypothetical protein
MKNIHWPAIGAAAMSILGFVAMNSDTIAHVVPPKYAAAVIGAGIVAQAITQSAHKPDAASPATV